MSKLAKKFRGKGQMIFSEMEQKDLLIFEWNLKKMGFIKILSYLYSKINSFEYSKV